MGKAYGKLGNIGWDLKASYSGEVSPENSEQMFDYFVVHEMLINNETKPSQHLHPLAYSKNNTGVTNMGWFFDELALIKTSRFFKLKTRGSYDVGDLNILTDEMYKLFIKEIPREEYYYLKEMSCLVWLNNMHYSPIFSLMVRASEASLQKYVNIMCSLRNSYQQLEDFSKEAVDIYMLPNEYVKALL